MRSRRAAVAGAVLLGLLTGCATGPTAGVDEQILAAEELGDTAVTAAESLHPVLIGADLRVSVRGGKPSVSREDERWVELFLRLVPQGAGPGASGEMQEAIESELLADGWVADELTRDAAETGEGAELWFTRPGAEGTATWDGDSPGDWHVSVRDRLDYVQLDVQSPFALTTDTQYATTDAVEARHPEWRSPDGVLP
ncbi:hypothetical protein HRK28_15410 [Rathayibacter sp. VKM Ac-2835]|uniref:hypothetical protein n=1 Tax=Rathayibacter sp. VKM Ac-2835 TaxID=2739043 RepID=UPI001563CE5F|nr:hypothetical protein [Rathayibacter sp. VKM Ac-2835]NRG42301.1 hypothetical protein [Rathayibacter sp. VKM Ac-2835]